MNHLHLQVCCHVSERNPNEFDSFEPPPPPPPIFDVGVGRGVFSLAVINGKRRGLKEFMPSFLVYFLNI